jgi:hypothetical protein
MKNKNADGDSIHEEGITAAGPTDMSHHTPVPHHKPSTPRASTSSATSSSTKHVNDDHIPRSGPFWSTILSSGMSDTPGKRCFATAHVLHHPRIINDAVDTFPHTPFTPYVPVSTPLPAASPIAPDRSPCRTSSPRRHACQRDACSPPLPHLHEPTVTHPRHQPHSQRR